MGRELTPEEMIEYKKQREKRGKEIAEMLGIPYDTLLEIEQKATEEVLSDTSLKKELNEKNKHKAGIK